MFEEDTFVEEMVIKRKGLKDYLLEILIIIIAVIASIALYLFIPFVNTVLIIIVVFCAYLFIKFRYVEYEYSFTNGDLDIDKIMAKRKRKQIFSVNCRQIQVMAPYTQEFESEVKDYSVSEIVDASASKNAAGRWFLISEKEGKYSFVVIQPSKRLREAMKKYLHSRMKEEKKA